MAGCAYYAVVFNKTKGFLLIIILRWKVPPQNTINDNRNFKRSFSFPFVDKRSLFLTKLFFEELNLVFCKVERFAYFWDNQGTQGGGGTLDFQVTEVVELGQKSLGLPTKPPQKSLDEFMSLKNYRQH